MKKIFYYLSLFIMIFCLSGCGNSGNKMPQNSSTSQETETSEVNEASITQPITVSSIQIEPSSKTMDVKLFLPEDISADGTDYWVGDLDVKREATVAATGGLEIELCGFYTDDAAWKDIKVYKGFQATDDSNVPLENVTITGEITQIESKKFEAAVDNSQVSIPVVITPYSVSICPTENWREEGHFYQVIATDINGMQYYMCYLPITDDRKAAEKKNTPLTNPTALDILGNDFSSAGETEHCGIRYTFNEEIDIDQIEKIDVETFIP